MVRRKLKRLQNGEKAPSSTKMKRSQAKEQVSPWIVTPLEPATSQTLQRDHHPLLNPRICSRSKELRTTWKKGGCTSDDVLELDPKPFKHCVIKNILKDSSCLDDLILELAELPYELMSSDLYSFNQTDSLLGFCETRPTLSRFLDLVKGPLRNWVQEVTGKKLSEKLTATASQYAQYDRLLCHDDNISDRSVAFIFYLSKDWDEQYGGSLDLFDCDSENQPQCVVKSITPSFGSFAFFEVTHNSYHQVAEIVNPDCVRLSINGWFHGKDLPAQVQWLAPVPKFLTPIQPRGCSLEKWINPIWLNSETNDDVKKCFQRELSVGLPKFLKASVYKEMLKAFKKTDIVWETCGPANRRRFKVAKTSTLPALIVDYLQLIQSKLWFRLLSEYTVDIDPDISPKPKCWFEVQQWQAGDYTLLVDNDQANNCTGMDVHLFFGVPAGREEDQGGDFHYLGPDRDANGCLESAAHLEPENNSVTIVARIEGMCTPTKYLDHRNKTAYYKIFAHYSQSLE